MKDFIIYYSVSEEASIIMESCRNDDDDDDDDDDEYQSCSIQKQQQQQQPPQLPPGFRFHPTDEELLIHYLKKKAASLPLPVPIIAEVDLYKFDPWELPAKACFGEHEWYFFSPRDRKYPNGARPNRAATSGYWKATGTDKAVMTTGGNGNGNGIGQKIGVKKALVFYGGKPPKGSKTNWIMHEYRLHHNHTQSPHHHLIPPFHRFLNNNNNNNNKLQSLSLRLDDWVLCRIYKKINPTKLIFDNEMRRKDIIIGSSFNNVFLQPQPQHPLLLPNSLFSTTARTQSQYQYHTLFQGLTGGGGGGLGGYQFTKLQQFPLYSSPAHSNNNIITDSLNPMKRSFPSLFCSDINNNNNNNNNDMPDPSILVVSCDNNIINPPPPPPLSTKRRFHGEDEEEEEEDEISISSSGNSWSLFNQFPHNTTTSATHQQAVLSGPIGGNPFHLPDIINWYSS